MSSSRFRSCCTVNLPAGAIKPELVFDGDAGKTIQVALGRYHPVPSRPGPMPDPIVPLELCRGERPRTKLSEPSR